MRARTPLASVIRTAARPVGAVSITRAPRATALAAIDLMQAVFPVPGPPVITDSRCSNAPSRAARCSEVGSSLPGAIRSGSRPSRSPAAAATSAPTRAASSASSSAVAAR